MEPRDGIFDWLVVSAMALIPEDSVSQPFSPFSSFSILFTPFSLLFPEPRGEVGLHTRWSLNLSTVTVFESLHWLQPTMKKKLL